jgi:hypothetical protein
MTSSSLVGRKSAYLSDGGEGVGCFQADELVGDPPDLAGGARRGHWHGQHDARRARSSGHLTGCGGSGSRGDPVVHDDRRPSGERPALAPGAKLCGAALELLPFAILDGADLVRRDPGSGDELTVDDANAAFTDGPHGQLRLGRHPELANEDDVERS